jgi:hypothetical protein
MPRVTLLTTEGATKITTLSRIPGLDEYIFMDDETLCVERVIHVTTFLGSRALISVRIVETHEDLPNRD